MDTKAIRKRCDAATVGPWKMSAGNDAIVGCPDGRAFIIGDAIYHPENKDNAEFIAHARTDTPALLDKVERLQEKQRDHLAVTKSFAIWAQSYLVFGKWAGHSIYDAVRQEMFCRDNRIAELEKLLAIAECPCCDGSGGYYNGEDECCQCQWCYEKENILMGQKAKENKK